MQQYTIHQAKTQLSKILKLVAQGKEICIVNRDKPVAKIVPLEPQKRRLGSLSGKVKIAADFDAPLEDFKEYME